jgi:hypothetical protein
MAPSLVTRRRRPLDPLWLLRQTVSDIRFVRRNKDRKLPVTYAGNRVYFDYYESGAAEFCNRAGRIPRWLRWLT